MMKIEPSVNHSGRINEYNITPAKLTHYNKKGIFNCCNPKCNKLIKVYDRIVSKRKSSSYDEKGNTDLYCKPCAILKIIIVEDD